MFLYFLNIPLYSNNEHILLKLKEFIQLSYDYLMSSGITDDMENYLILRGLFGGGVLKICSPFLVIRITDMIYEFLINL